MNLWVLLDVRDSADPKIVIQKNLRTQSEDMGKSNVVTCFHLHAPDRFTPNEPVAQKIAVQR